MTVRRLFCGEQVSEFGYTVQHEATTRRIALMSKVKCSGCGSEKVIPNIKIVDHGEMNLEHDLAIKLHGRPDALFFKDTRRSVLKASVCGRCGKVEMSVENPQELWEIYERHRST